jgi:hypothetical protein
MKFTEEYRHKIPVSDMQRVFTCCTLNQRMVRRFYLSKSNKNPVGEYRFCPQPAVMKSWHPVLTGLDHISYIKHHSSRIAHHSQEIG